MSVGSAMGDMFAYVERLHVHDRRQGIGPVTLAELLSEADNDAGRTEPDLVHAGADSATRSQLAGRADAIADACRSIGVTTGAPVAVMLPNGIDLVATLFGVWQAGGVYVPINPRLTDTEAARILNVIDPAAVVTVEAHRGRFGPLPVAVLGSGPPATHDGTPGTGRFDPDVALVQFTSGTTGTPKAVLLTHSGVISLIDGVLDTLRGGSSDRPAKDRPPMPNIVPVSLSLWAGIYTVLFAFRTGAPVVIMDTFDPVEFADLVRRFGIRSSVLPPAAMALLSDDDRVTSLAPLRFVRSITAPLSPLQARRFQAKFGLSVLNGWGQTEIGGEIVGWNAQDTREFGDAKLGSVGRPHRGVHLRFVDTSDDASDGGLADVAAGEPGEIWAKTPAMSAGYADGSDFGDRMSPDGWFRTGDVGRMDGDGFVWIEGRVSDMINRGGLKVHPGEVEEVLRLSRDVADVSVVGVPDDRLGEVPVAFIVPVTADRPLDPEALRSLCRDHLAPYKVPVRFEPLEALPRNDVGKVVRTELIDRARTSAI